MSTGNSQKHENSRQGTLGIYGILEQRRTGRVLNFRSENRQFTGG